MGNRIKGIEQEEKWPGLSEKERDRRWELVRNMMKAKGLECLVVFGLKSREQFDNYLTNDRTGSIVIFPLEGELVHLVWHPQWITSHIESARRGEESWVRDMRVGTNGSVVVKVLREKGYDKANIGVVGVSIFGAGEVEGYVPYNTWQTILNNLPDVKFCDVSTDFARIVLMKSNEELILVRRAAEIGELAAEKMMEMTRPGVSESEIYAAIMHELFLNGANGNNVPYATPMIIHSGTDNPSWGPPIWLVRGQPPRVVQKGDIVQSEIFSFYGRFEAQLQMSIAIEPVSSVNKECAAIARESYRVGIESLRPGKTFGEVIDAMEEPLKQSGAWHVTPLIHSLTPLSWASRMGVGMEKLPGIENYNWGGATQDIGPDLIIPPNTVWELEPNAGLGINRVNIGGTVLVTEDGALELNRLSNEMRITG